MPLRRFALTPTPLPKGEGLLHEDVWENTGYDEGLSGMCRLDGGDGDGVDDVIDQRAAREVVHRFAHAL